MKPFKIKLDESEYARFAAQISIGGEAIILVKRDFMFKLAHELNEGAEPVFIFDKKQINDVSIRKLYRQIYFYIDYVKAYARGLNSAWTYVDNDLYVKEGFFGYEKEDLLSLCAVYGFDNYELFYQYAAAKGEYFDKSLSGASLTNPYSDCSALTVCSRQRP